jgi:cell wall-associated NlpC family hydrolase
MKNIYLLISLIFLASCGSNEAQKIAEANSLLEEIRLEFAPDKRVSLLDLDFESNDGKIIIKGETTTTQAVDKLKVLLQEKEYEIIDSINYLPSSALGDTLWAVVNNSVSNVRSAPKHSAELATQVTLGMPLRILKHTGDWYLVQTPDQYIAWIDAGGIQPMTALAYKFWESSRKIIFTKTYGHAYDGPEQNTIVADMVMGAVAAIVADGSKGYDIRYPDGRYAWVTARESEKMDDWLANVEADGESMVALSRQFIGIPYLWGGTSTKGMDCSGFTKTIYFMHGLVIPRDASQQVMVGTDVDNSKNWGSLEYGDLLFFGNINSETGKEKVVHVGMWIGNDSFVHASGSGQIRISSVDSSSDLYDVHNVSRYLRTKRYLGDIPSNVVNLKNDNIFYAKK